MRMSGCEHGQAFLYDSHNWGILELLALKVDGISEKGGLWLGHDGLRSPRVWGR